MASTIRRGLGPKPGQKKVTFQCKDTVIVAYCGMKFGAEFTGWANQVTTAAGADLALRKMHQTLTEEAKRQEWFDYALFGDGLLVPHERKLILGMDDKPELLIPRAVVVDAT